MPRRKPRVESTKRSRVIPKQKERVSHEKPKIRLQGQTPNQNDYISCISEYDIVFCTGPAGCGKSYIAAGMASKFIMEGKYSQVIVTRPLVCTGKDVGSLPGELSDKINPYLGPMQENLKKFLGPHYGLLVNDRTIRFEPLEMMRGFTFDNSIMILDEAQNCTIEQIKMFVTRIGKDSKVLINGDTKQTDLKKSGLDFIINKVRGVKEIAICELDYDDIQRRDLVYTFLRAVEE
jgi:phosphate starvation-inducible PhoH-like protein